MTKRVLLSLAVCCFFVFSPIRAVSAGEPAGAVRAQLTSRSNGRSLDVIAVQARAV